MFARTRVLLSLAIILCATAVELGSRSADLPSVPAAPPIAVPLPNVAQDVWAIRGQVVRQDDFAGPLEDPQSVIGGSWRAVYNSVSGVDGGVRRVSGAFFVPRGNPPHNGWPVISFAHGTTGIDNACGPSTESNLMGDLPLIRDFLTQGYAVAVTDYEGLGEPGSHPYLEPRTAAFNVIDAVRALRTLSASVSPGWVAYGSSQGGETAWAANEFNAYYGDGINLLGSVAVSPAVNLSGVADLAWTGSLTAPQAEYLPLVIAGLVRYNADLSEQPYLHGQVASAMDSLTNCKSPVSNMKNPNQAAADLTPNTPQDVDRLRDALRRIALPQRALDKPMLVVNGTRDAVVLPGWVASAVTGSCELGGRIKHIEVAGADHTDATNNVDEEIRDWVADRFAGAAAPSTCQTPAQTQR